MKRKHKLCKFLLLALVSLLLKGDQWLAPTTPSKVDAQEITCENQE